MGIYLGYGRESKTDANQGQFELRSHWEVGSAGDEFRRIFGVGLLGFVGHVKKVFSPPQSVVLLFEFGPGMREEFVNLVDKRTFPPATLDAALNAKPAIAGKVVPDDPGQHRDRWWRSAAAGNAIGASFREAGTSTSIHIAFNDTMCDVHVDRNGFIVTGNGYTHWDLNGLLRHLTVDLAGDKLPWVMLSAGYVNKRNRPIIQATLSPWLAVDLPSRESGDKTNVKVGLALTGVF